MAIKLGNIDMNDRSEVFITFEAGPTHDGLDSAKKLVDVAAEAGADAVKFQMTDAERLMGSKDVIFSYKILVDRGKDIFEEKKENLYELITRRVLKRDEWIELKKHADKKNLAFFCTATFSEEVDFLVDELGVDSIKVGSADIDHLPLIRHVSKKNVNIQLDTGSGNLWEIERAVRLIEENNSNIIIHHCPSGYPARLESIHLNMIPTLKAMFPDYLIAFSDHTPGWDMDIAAIALGAEMVEKTITLDRMTPSVEHCFSLEPAEANKFIESVRYLEKALGRSSRTLPRDILEGRRSTRRSIVTRGEVPEGGIFTWDNIDFRRPGFGISPSYADIIVGKKANGKLGDNQLLDWSDIG